ncbi:SPRY domain-containing protein 3 [Syngnathoides biaculeatus]|uniref:SPRY domain-containing protein 3 n=1 Tax=Syngnathoides biaculeatus TaxID=300417 RepID=UPI002ADD9955|nr:SPRY domain-containing protein 3 [Syngnathoides biaculeatus]XP_061688830.1 SPRY domain-containing protein 3 [Syngnathoides biaculeatus]XP_061688831.1 SPRY domain-containing protein 3 [Syngnathoides biaculeatus]XP_061688833.1 SPRY domain-containing protein 3 [Syngnathoides biaculeatus]
MEDINLHYRFLNWRRRIREIREVRPVRYRERLKRMLRDGDVLRYHGNSDEVGCFVAARPLSKRSRYFEITIVDTGVRGMIAVGLVPQLYKLDHQPGWLPNSVAFHADDGKLYNGNTVGQQFGPKCCRGDRIGCGISLDSEDGQLTVFFTKNGKEVGSLDMPAAEALYPAVGMHSLGEEVLLDLHAEWKMEEDDGLMIVDSHEDDWGRLHDIRVSGTLLEYTGKGKSIVDVGLAQALRPLNTRFHYYELEITDAGEKCYIALGLARKDYPKNRHPGWSRGSIAYHADDGKLFQGSGVGDAFGPRCFEGDLMGCGIMFPRDYSHESRDDADDWEPDAFPRPSEVQNDLYMGNDDDDDDDDEEVEEDLEGTKVTVFFTRNGNVVGRREVVLPAGGFYPTIGMMSTGEKVKVDLHPLSG